MLCRFRSDTHFWHQWPWEVKIWNQWKLIIWVLKSKLFWCSKSILRPFMTSDEPWGRDLQISMTSGCQNIKSIKISIVRYQIWYVVNSIYILTTGCPKKHGNSMMNSISSLLWISILIPNFKAIILLCLLEFILWKG